MSRWGLLCRDNLKEAPLLPLLDEGTPVRSRRLRPALVAIDVFAAATAVDGGIALATGLERERLPGAWLLGTPFRSYRVPGLLLAGLVGGSASGAAVATLHSPRGGGRASLLAGGVLMGWIVGEIRLLQQPVGGTWTERFFFAVGLMMAVLGLTVGQAE